jgi:hypothetical protein
MSRARQHLLNRKYQAAVEELESQLKYCNGNRVYLDLLKEAYRAYIRELRLNNQEALALKVYVPRLQYLDPEAAQDKSNPLVTISPTTAQLAAAAAPPPAKTSATVRLKSEDEDPGHAANPGKRSAARDLVARAEQEYTQRRYREARLLYEKAHQEDQTATEASRERWAYCNLYSVVEQLNQKSSRPQELNDLERDVRKALELAPRLEYGKVLLGEIQKRRGAGTGNALAAETRAPVISVNHYERNAEGWALAETRNFRVFHNQPRELAEEAARIAERTRSAMLRQWFGEGTDAWSPKCDLYLHATSRDYSRSTGVPESSPGHSSIRSEGSRVLSRRIDLRCDDPNLLIAVLPHETTHVVLAGQFGDRPVPRWADEGIAVLTEPRDKIDRHLRNLPEYYRDRQLFGVRRLMQMNDYPDPYYIGPFYAQSVSLVEFLTNERGHRVFTQFLREALRTGYDTALQKHYGFRSFEELQDRWTRYAIGETVTKAGSESGSP